VVLVAVLDTAPLREVDAQRRAEERGLDVVGGQCVAREEDVDPAGVHEGDHRRRGARVHHARSAHPEHLLARGLRLNSGVTVLQECLHQKLRTDTERAGVGVDVQEGGGCAITEVGQALT